MKARAAGFALRPLTVPKQEVTTLSNGLTTHVISRGPLPLVAVRLVIRAGSVYEAKGAFGVADFAARLMRRGANGKSADVLSESIEFVAASMGGFANEENVILALSTPAKHLESMLSLMGELLLAPDFKDSEVELARRRSLAQLQNDLDDPGSLADRALVKGVWGDHAYGHDPGGGKADLQKLTRQQLVQFQKTKLGPKISQLYIVGDVNLKKVHPLIEKVFGQWKGGPETIPEIPAWKGLAHNKEVFIVDKPEQTQAQVRIGASGVKRGHRDHFALTAMNTVLGGGFTSRLVRELRVKRGLTYGAGCSFDMLSNTGSFTLSSFTKTETVGELIDVSLGEVKKMRSKGPTQAELQTVQRYISGLYPARLETNDSVAGAISDVVHYRLDAEWISKFRERLCEVTVPQAALAAKEHLFESDRVLALCGNAKKLEKQLANYGRVTVLTPEQLD
jgi:zinc protease